MSTKNGPFWFRDIRKKGRNKLHALRCRQRQREEVRLLQERVQLETETRRRLQETHEQVGARDTRVCCDTCHVTEEEGAGDLHQAAGPGTAGDWGLSLLNRQLCACADLVKKNILSSSILRILKLIVKCENLYIFFC